MRATQWARWATCALAISICVPAFADRKRSLSDCTAFDQAEKGEDGMEMTIHNKCTIPVDCTLSWRVVCAPKSKARRSVHPGSAKFAVTEGAAQSTAATAAVCGDDSWEIGDVQWTCQPAKD
jgi:hypothetical protein